MEPNPGHSGPFGVIFKPDSEPGSSCCLTGSVFSAYARSSQFSKNEKKEKPSGWVNQGPCSTGRGTAAQLMT